MTDCEALEASLHLDQARESILAALALLENRKGVPVREVDRLSKVLHKLDVSLANVRHTYAPAPLTPGDVAEAWLASRSLCEVIERWLVKPPDSREE